jgi:hypothetical protein
MAAVYPGLIHQEKNLDPKKEIVPVKRPAEE